MSLANAGLPTSYKVEIYDNIPTKGGSVLSSDFIPAGQTVNGQVVVPSFTKRAYAIVTRPEGVESMQMQDASGRSINKVFTVGKKMTTTTVVVSPDCNSGCDVTINTSNNYTISSSP